MEVEGAEASQGGRLGAEALPSFHCLLLPLSGANMYDRWPR